MLLIIFMVVTPMLQSGIPVLLPETDNPEKYPEGQKQVKVAIQEDGKIFIGQDWVPTRAELTERMEEHARERTPEGGRHQGGPAPQVQATFAR